jgi:beta-glucosidase
MAIEFSRRSFARLLGAAAGAVSLPAAAAALPKSISSADNDASGIPPSSGRAFPDGFLWGSAVASYQVEGGVHDDGRGLSIWDTFSHTPGKIANGDTGDVADDSFHRYREDVQLMKSLGLKVCRFSISWPRIYPTGTGTMNQRGMDYYNRLVDELLNAGIQPFCTLYHWDLPQALQDRGGWENPDTGHLFAQYAAATAARLSDRVTHFMTMNEIRSFVELGYGTGLHAPGLQVGPKRLAQISHYAVLGHGLAVQAIRASARPGTKIGIADNLDATTPVIDTPENVQAAARAIRERNAMFLTVIQEGRYTDAYLRRLGPDAPRFTAEELKIISSPMDFTGLNIYTATPVRADHSELGYALVPNPTSYPHMFSSWVTLGPEALYWAPKLVANVWNVNEIYITENGASSADVLNDEGHVLDSDRIMYLRSYLTQLHRAVSEGVPVKGYCLWSLLDNFEWADGYGKRFGITYVDFKTEKRTPKLSAEFYRNVIARNSVG